MPSYLLDKSVARRIVEALYHLDKLSSEEMIVLELVLALATYGTDSTGDILGVDGLITLDKPLLNHFRVHQAELQIRLLAMTRQFSRPYCRATLPVVLHPDRFFKEASSGGLPNS